MRLTRRSFLHRSLGTLAGVATLATLGMPPRSAVAQAQTTDTRVQSFRDDQPAEYGLEELPAGTTHVGIHWRGEGHADGRAWARTSFDGQDWSGWAELTIDDDPFDGDETYTGLLATGGARWVQYRVVLAGGRRPARVTLTSIGAGSPLGRAAPAAGPSWSFVTPDGRTRGVFTREDWGCDESLGLDAGSRRVWPAIHVATQKIVVHHTATSNDYADGAAQVRAIHAYHAETKGWGDIGYHALLDRFGNVYEGRRGRDDGGAREILSSGVVAGHALGHNYGTSGIAIIGDFTKRKLKPKTGNDRMLLAALEDVTIFECARAGLHPLASGPFLRSNDTWRENMPTISAHKDAEATLCPGTTLYAYLKTLRKNALSRLDDVMTPTVTLTEVPRREVGAPASLTFTWSGSASGYRFRLEGWRKVGADNVEYWTPDGWSTVESRDWTTDLGTRRVSFTDLPPGRYTFHVRPVGAGGKPAAVEASATVLVR